MPTLRYKGQPQGSEEKGLSQLFEETEYVFPAPGSKLVVPSGVASWLQGKHPGLLEIVDSDPGIPESRPNRLVATVPAAPEKAAESTSAEPASVDAVQPAEEPVTEPPEPRRSRR